MPRHATRTSFQRSPLSNEERFWLKVRKTSGCWYWTGANDGRYGNFTTRAEGDQPAKRWVVHRLAYVLAVGPIPAGLTIDHVRERGCTSTLCCRPDHLQPVTSGENTRRGRALRTHCRRGHALTPDNTYVKPSSPERRRCRTCERHFARASARKRRAA